MKKLRALGPNLIIKMETGEIKIGSFIVAAEGTREAMSREEGTIEQLGEDAFSDLAESNRPKIGDKVILARYDGKTVIESKDSEDKLERRVIQDTRILAVIEGE